MPITLDGTTGITAPGVTDTGNLSVAGTSTLTGSIGNVTAGTISSGAITSSGLVTGATGALYPIVNGTAQASTSGTSIDFTGIPSWVKRITVNFVGVSTNGTSNYQVQLGYSGGVEVTGYQSVAADRADETQSLTGFIMSSGTAATTIIDGTMSISLVNTATNTWAEFGNISGRDIRVWTFAGSKALTGTLDRIRITTVNGTDTFDAGSINIQYE